MDETRSTQHGRRIGRIERGARRGVSLGSRIGGRRFAWRLAVVLAASGGALTAQESGRRVIGLDENAWPIFADEGGAPARPTPAANGSVAGPSATAAGADGFPATALSPVPPMPRLGLPRGLPSAVRSSGSSGAGSSAAGTATVGAASPATRPASDPARASGLPIAGRRGDPRTALWRNVGQPREFEALQGLRLDWRLSVLVAETGSTLGRRHLSHLADPNAARRDRLEYVDGRVYRRDGAVLDAELHGLSMSSLLPGARGELEVLGLLLRVPFCFADAERFELSEVVRSPAVPGSNAPRQIELTFLPRGAERALWPDAEYRLRLEADSGQPLSLEYQLVAGRRRTVRLVDWRRVGRVAIAHRFEVLSPLGQPSLVLEIEQLRSGEAFVERTFSAGR